MHKGSYVLTNFGAMSSRGRQVWAVRGVWVAGEIRFNLRCGAVQEDADEPMVFAQVWFALKTKCRTVLSTSQAGGECNGCMDTAGRVALPAAFEHADIDNLALLIGNHSLSSLYRPPLMSECYRS